MNKLMQILLLGTLLAGSTFVAAADKGDEEQAVRSDCRVEGEAGGLSGKDLDEFVESCVSELLGVELINVAPQLK